MVFWLASNLRLIGKNLYLIRDRDWKSQIWVHGHTESAWEKRPTGANMDTMTGDTFRPSSVKEAWIIPGKMRWRGFRNHAPCCYACQSKTNYQIVPVLQAGGQEEPRGQDDGRTPMSTMTGYIWINVLCSLRRSRSGDLLTTHRAFSFSLKTFTFWWFNSSYFKLCPVVPHRWSKSEEGVNLRLMNHQIL